MEPTLQQKAEAILGQPLPPRETPEFVKALAEIGRKDPQLAKALMSAAKPEAPQVNVAATERKVRAARASAERQARLRQVLRDTYERIFVRRTSTAGRPIKAPRKGAWLLLLLLVASGALGILYFSINSYQKPQQTVLNISAAKAQKMSDAELQAEAEKALGKPLPKPGDPDYQKSLQELQRKSPALADELQNRQETTQAQQAGKDAVAEIAGNQKAPALTVTPPTSKPQGEAVPPPPQTTPPPAVPPPPTTPSGSSGSATADGQLPPAFPIQERPPSRPYLGEAGAGGTASGQGSGGGSGGSGGAPAAARGLVFVEAPAREAKAPTTTSDKERTRAVGFTEAAANKPSLQVFDGGAVASGPGGPIGPGMPPAASTSNGGVVILDNSSKPGQWKVLAEATPPASTQSTSPQSTPAPAPDPTQGKRWFEDITPQPAPTQTQTQAAPTQTQTQAAPAPARTYPYTPGRSVTARLQVRLAVVEGSESPVILEGADGSLWVGKATLGPLARVNIDLDTLYVGGSSYRVRAQAYDQDRQIGLVANVQEQSPSLAQDVLRASAAALGQYVDLLSKQTSTTQLPGGGVAQSQQAPPLEAVVLGNIGRLFALPSDRKSLVRVGQVEAGKLVQVMVMGFEGNP